MFHQYVRSFPISMVVSRSVRAAFTDPSGLLAPPIRIGAGLPVLVGSNPAWLLSISDIETTDLDVAAMEHGYARPPLKDFAVRR